MPTECFALLLGGDMINAFFCAFTSTVGMWFFPIMLITSMAVAFLKTGSITPTAIIALFGGTGMLIFWPSSAVSQSISFIAPFILIGVAGILYKLVKGRM